LSALPVKTTQSVSLAPLISKPPQSSHSASGFLPGALQGVFMICYQVLVQYAFIQHKAVLVSTHIKKQNAGAFLVRLGLPFGSGLKYRRFFKTKNEAVWFVSHLRGVYRNRIIPNPPLLGGQLYLFQEVSE
jgi:hypothetical protein